MITIYYLMQHPIWADIPLPTPTYSDIELGEPRLPPYQIDPYLWLIPVTVILVLAVLAVLRKKTPTNQTANSKV